MNRANDAYGDITVILPTLNEAGNISAMLDSLTSAYPGCGVIVADDGSRDGTKEAALERGEAGVELLDRTDREVQGLAASVLDAIALVKTRYFIVMDADGQHATENVKRMAGMLRSGRPVVVGKRDGIEGDWGRLRRAISASGTAVGRAALFMRGRSYSGLDILSGLFGFDTAFCRDIVSRRRRRAGFRLKGYKILFDLLKSVPRGTAIGEVPYVFRTRTAESSKINIGTYAEFLMSCLLP